MTKTFLLITCFFISFFCFSQDEQALEKIKYRKLDYNDFLKYSTNDTTAMVIDIFFDKKDNTALGQMSFLPITVATYLISPPISIGLTAVSLPLFLNGSYLLIKYRKKKLYLLLEDYNNTGNLPKWIKKKAIKQLEAYELLKEDY
ncbi:MAG: hypothetical protein ACPGSL_06180 [Vicingaceae bacterium]